MTSQYPQGWDPLSQSQFPATREAVSDQGDEPPPHPAARTNALPLIAIALVTGGLLVVGAALGAMLYGKSRDTGSAGPATVTTTATHTPADETTETATTTTTRTVVPPGVPGAGAVDGTDVQGFLGNPARCNVDDPAVFIGRTARSHVVVCRAGATGGLYYVGYAGGHRSDDVSWPEINGSTYVFRTRGASYQVGPNALTIVTPSTTVTEPWLESWRE